MFLPISSMFLPLVDFNTDPWMIILFYKQCQMLKPFLPIIFFSIALPLIDIVTDLRIIIRLYETHKNFATLLLGVLALS